MNPISSGLSIFKWLFVRLPLAFSIPFTAMSLWWVLYGFSQLNDVVAAPATRFVAATLQANLPNAIGDMLAANLADFFHAAIVIGLFSLGFLVAYNASALVNWLLLTSRLKPLPFAAGSPWIPPNGSHDEDPFANAKRIGIVLAGGGAKGAFQAGAMKAIYRYLAEYNALGKVKVISGTSIGSWNALFWLSDLVDTDRTNKSIHERWWRAISVKSLAAPLSYVPFLRNAFLSSEPWQQAFDRLFGRVDVCTRLL
jgi:hypothetical protein